MTTPRAPRDRTKYDAGRKRSGPSGPTTPEAERPGCRVRLDAGAAAAVDALAARWGVSRTEAIARAVEVDPPKEGNGT